MNILKDMTVHSRTVHIRIEWPELQVLLVQAAADELVEKVKDFIATVEITQEEEGSPAYKIQKWRASITLVKNLI